MDTSFSDFQERLEKMLLFQLTLNLKNGKLSPEEAQKIAQDYLSISASTKEELLQGLINIGHTHTVVGPVVAHFSKEYDEEFKNSVLSHMTEKLHNGDMNGAIEEAKKGGVHA